MTQNDVKAEKTQIEEDEAIEENGAAEEIEPEQEKSDKGFNTAKELEEMKNRYFRALADYQNLQRRTAKEQLEARGRGVEDFLKKLLPVLDTLDKAMEQIAKISGVDKKIMDGLEMFSIQLSDVLEKEGLKPIPAVGKKFDPNIHEALCRKTDEEQDDEIVLNEFEKGYAFKERVLRTSKVEINHK